MRRHALFFGLWFLGLAGLALFSGWAFFGSSHVGHGWRNLGPLWPYLLGGVATVVALGVFLMRLAFYSAKHGYDDQADPDRR